MGEVLFSGWTGKLIVVIALMTFVDMFFTIIQLIHDRSPEHRNRIAACIDSILALAALMPLIACLVRISGIYQAMKAFSHGAVSGMVDSKLMLIGMAQAFLPLLLGFGLFFFFLIVWIILRGVHRSYRKLLAGATEQ